MPTSQERARFRQLDREQSRYEAFWQPKIEGAINRQIRPFINVLKDKGKDYALAHINDLVDPGPMNEVLTSLYKTVGTQAANSEWGYLQKTYGSELNQEKRFGFNRIWASIIQNLFSTFGGLRIVSITQTERDRIRTELEKASQDPNITNFELAQALESADIPRARSKVIVRTETGTASSAGGEAAARRTGILMEKTWLSTQDNRTRHLPEDWSDHRTMNGVTVGMDDKFLVPTRGGAELMSRPHDPTASAGNVIQCRCKTIYRAVRDAAGRFIRISNPENISV